MCKFLYHVYNHLRVSFISPYIIAVCGYGTYSPTGLVPCLQCPSNSYTGEPPIDGFKECFKCPTNSYTYSPGSKESSDCRGKLNIFQLFGIM